MKLVEDWRRVCGLPADTCGALADTRSEIVARRGTFVERWRTLADTGGKPRFPRLCGDRGYFGPPLPGITAGLQVWRSVASPYMAVAGCAEPVPPWFLGRELLVPGDPDAVSLRDFTSCGAPITAFRFSTGRPH